MRWFGLVQIRDSRNTGQIIWNWQLHIEYGAAGRRKGGRTQRRFIDVVKEEG